ncbi:MAG: alpha/beta hydrolase [Actinomycetota bacterium]
MRYRFAAPILLVCLVLTPGPAVASSARNAFRTPPFVREAVSFVVTNPMDPLATYTVRGRLIRPKAGCTMSVLLALHGLSYDQRAWDFPIRPKQYSVAEALARRGHALLAIDRLGYGRSSGEGSPDQPNGYTLTVEGYADMTAQIIEQLRAGTYAAKRPSAFGRVGLIGHSAGSEIAELTAALNPGLVDVLIPTAYTHEPWVNNEWLVASWVPDNLAAAQSDYVYFEDNPQRRAAEMYHLPHADRDVVAWDNRHAHLTPSGEIFSIGSQPSRFLLPLITVPVLLVLAENDTLFPASFGDEELLWFQGTDDLELLVVPRAGHTFMLHRGAGATNARIAGWLDARFPKCAARTAIPY